MWERDATFPEDWHDNVGASLAFRGSQRATAEGSPCVFLSWPNRGFHPFPCLAGLLTLVEPKATLHVEVQGMADLDARE